MLTTTEYKHIVKEASGDVFVEGTRISVAEIVNTLEFGSKASESNIEALVHLYPEGYLTQAKLYSALAYYHDHADQIQKSLRDHPPAEFKKDANGNWIFKK